MTKPTKRTQDQISKMLKEVREMRAMVRERNRNRLLTIKEAAHQLSTSEAMVKRLIAAKKLRTTPGVTMNELERFVERLMREQHPQRRR